MTPKIKISRAYKAMKVLGYTSQIVKPILKNLLDLYDQNWELIEDEQYKVLLDAIIEAEEYEANKKKEMESPSLYMSSVKLKKAYRSMEDLGYSQDTVEPVLKTLLDLYDHNWQRIEDEQYKVLVAAILEKHGSKEKSQQRYQISHEHLEDTLPGRRYRLEHQMLQTSTYDDHSSPSQAAKRTTESHGKQKFPYSACYLEDTMIEARSLPPLKYHKKTENFDSQNYCLELDDLLPGEEIDESDPQSAEVLHISGSENDYSGSMEQEKKNDLDEYATATKDMEQSPDGRLEFSFPPSVTFPDHCGLAGHCSECKRLFSDEEKKHPVYPAQLDIASSSNGDAKISIIFKSPLGSNFNTPSIEALSRRMEKDFLQSYGLRQSGFSMLKFMKDVCECFLAAGTMPTANNMVRAENFVSDLGMTKKFESQDVLIGSPNHEIASDNSPETQMYLNLDETVPQSPRLLGLNCLDLCGRPSSPTLRSMAIVKKENLHRESFIYYIEDITQGEEDVKISLVNEFNNECQPKFKYIPRNISFRNAYVQFPLARISDNSCCPDCSGNCLSSEIPCACASETSGSFAYTPEGIVKDTFLELCISIDQNPKPENFFYCGDCPKERSENKSLSEKCKGHLLRKFIKECWYKCGCGMECANRVVQKGIKFKLQVFMTSEGKGWGLRPLGNLPKGAFVCEYVGEVVTNTELYERNMESTEERHTYPVLLDADWGAEGVLKDDDALCLDATYYGNVARFINHRCLDANLIGIPVEVETPDHHYYHLAFFTKRKISALEELTWDYGIDFEDYAHPVKAFQCRCGSEFCRNVKPLKRRKIEQ